MKLMMELNENIEYLTENTSEGKNYYIEGVFLQSEIVNRNKRMYPKKAMARAVEEYTRDYIDRNRALGEANHPSCGLLPYRVMTADRGLVDIRDINIGDEVMSINPTTLKVERKKVTATINEEYEGDAIAIKFDKKIDLLVTPDHRFLVVNRNGKPEFLYAEDIFKSWGSSELAHSYFPKASKNTTTYTPHEIVIGEHSIDFQVFCEFLAFYLAEGCSGVHGSSIRTTLYQKKEQNIPLINDLLSKLPFKWKSYVAKNGCTRWESYDRHLGNYLTKLGNCYSKYIPEEILGKMDGETAKKFLVWYIRGDGRGQLDTKNKQSDVFSTSPRMADGLAIIVTHAGYVPRQYTYVPDKDVVIEGRTIKKENKSPLHFVSIQQKRGIYLDPRFNTTVEKIKYSGRKYCLTVEDNATFMWEDSLGHCHWTGNSVTINIDRVSHRIVSLTEQGNDYIGKAKLMNTPMGVIAKNLMDEGCKLGVSSRGLGSIQKDKNGIMVVQEDFFLATAADLVVDPSAPAAFVDGIMENVEWICNNGVWSAVQIEETQKAVHKMTHEEREAAQLAIFEQFMATMAQKTL